MRDVNRRRVELANNVADRGQNLDLGGDIQRGSGLVKNNEIGSAG